MRGGLDTLNVAFALFLPFLNGTLRSPRAFPSSSCSWFTFWPRSAISTSPSLPRMYHHQTRPHCTTHTSKTQTSCLQANHPTFQVISAKYIVERAACFFPHITSCSCSPSAARGFIGAYDSCCCLLKQHRLQRHNQVTTFHEAINMASHSVTHKLSLTKMTFKGCNSELFLAEMATQE